MNRKQFIQSQGATCDNWTWSWSFVNTKKRVVIFGAWDMHTNGNTSLIFSEAWRNSANGKKPPGFEQSKRHIHLIVDEGYQLQTFPIIFSDSRQDENGYGPAKIESFIPKLSTKILMKVGDDWFASDGIVSTQVAEEVVNPEQYVEGASKQISVNVYERNADARAKCIEHYGYKCAVCSFDFEEAYGSIGEHYIHVHHLVPLSEIKKEYKLDPIKHLRPVCPNCHAIIHRTQPALSIDQLRKHRLERITPKSS